MSTVSGIASKGDKEKGPKQKYSSLNINTLYKGKSLENPKTAVAPKHGLQTLGKVGAGRRIPPPANLPSLKSENAGNFHNINLVPSGGQGWVKEKQEENISMTQTSTNLFTAGPQAVTTSKMSLQSNQDTITASQITNSVAIINLSQPLSSNVNANANVIETSNLGGSKTWSSITSSQEDGGHSKNFLAPQSLYFPQEFPKLDGGVVVPEGSQKQNTDCTYGPGPSLRPQTEGSWSRGTAMQHLQQLGNQPVNSGNGVNGQPLCLTSPILNPTVQAPSRAYTPNIAIPPPPPVSRCSIPTALPLLNPRNQNLIASNSAPIGPLNPQFRPLVPPYIYGRNAAYPGGYPPPPHQPQPYPSGALQPYSRQPYHDPNSQYDVRLHSQPIRILDDEPSSSFIRPAPAILSDKDLKGFDEILDNEGNDDWASAQTEIDYNAKLVFSDDEDNSKVDLKVNRKTRSDEQERNNEDYEQTGDWENKHKNQIPKYRPPISSGQWQSNLTGRSCDYRNSGPQNISYSSGASLYSGIRGKTDLSDDDEMWRQRSRQHSDEMSAAVARARQRREEDEKRYEQSRLAAQEKARALEEKAKQMAAKKSDTVDRENRENRENFQNRNPQPKRDMRELPYTRKTREIREIKDNRENLGHEENLSLNEKKEESNLRPNKDSRIPNSYSNSNYGNKIYAKNMPPRFQKQAELKRQMLQQSWTPPLNGFEQGTISRQLHYDQPSFSDLRSNSSYTSSRVSNRSRSDSQGSVPEGFDNEEKWSRRSQSKENWRSQKEINSENIKNTESAIGKESNENVTQSNYLNKNITEERFREKSNEVSSIRSESRTSLNTRESSPSMLEEKKSLTDHEENLPSKRTNSSKESKFKNRDRLDWSAENENLYLDIAPYLGSVKRDWHRPIPITQKQFESVVEPVKVNFIPLKIGGIQEIKESNLAPKLIDNGNNHLKKTSEEKVHEIKTEENKTLFKDAEILNKNEGKKEKESKKEEILVAQNESVIFFTESFSPKLGSEGQASQETTNQSSNKSDVSSVSQEKSNNVNKAENFSSREKHKDYYEVGSKNRHHNYSRNQGSIFRGNSSGYRRPRTNSDRVQRFDKYKSSHVSRVHSKSKKKLHNSDGFSQESNKHKSSHNENQPINTNSAQNDNSSKSSKDKNNGKEKASTSANHQATNNPTLPIYREDSKRGRGPVAFRNVTGGMARTYGSNNYGPPSSKPAFGETRGTSKVNAESSETQNEEKPSLVASQISSDSSKNSQAFHKENSRSNSDVCKETNTISHSSKNSSKNLKESSHYRRQGIPNESSVPSHRSKELPPRFQKKQNNSRSGRVCASGSSRNSTNKDNSQSNINAHSCHQCFTKCQKENLEK